MKPHEEQWRVHPIHSDQVILEHDDGTHEAIMFADNDKVRSHGPERIDGYGDADARAQLAAAAPEMARVLLSYAQGKLDWECPACKKDLFPNDGDDTDHIVALTRHASDCALMGVLRKAGVLPVDPTEK